MNLHLNPYVCSTYNLNNFIIWMEEKADLEDFVEALNTVSVEHHARSEGDAPKFHNIQIWCRQFERYVSLWEEECDGWECFDCAKARGRRDFHWVGPWTCPCFIADEFMSQEDIYLRWKRCSRCNGQPLLNVGPTIQE